MSPVRVFIGVDPRQPLAYNVLQWSIHKHASERVQIEPLRLETLPIKRRGLTEFTFSRFLVPWLCDYQGSAIFLDADQVVTGDICELAALSDGTSSVQVNKQQKPFEWPSVMLFNNYCCRALTPEYIDDETNNPYTFSWGTVGELPSEWNHCVGYAEPRLDAKLYHYTQGIPYWPEVRGLPEDGVWFYAAEQMKHSVSWVELMGKSVHAKPVLTRMFKRYGIDVG